jgi:hypothetical protein
MMRISLLGSLLALGFTVHQPAAVHADSVRLETSAPIAVKPIRNYVNLRIGTSSSGLDEHRPQICLELAPLAWASIEACGNGSLVLHNDPIPELAHFRAFWGMPSHKLGDFWVRPRIGAGFAELQVGQDAPGFFFGGTDPAGNETAGPEGLFSVQAFTPLGFGLELVGELHAGVAYLKYAPQLTRPMSEIQPFAGLSVGVGF